MAIRQDDDKEEGKQGTLPGWQKSRDLGKTEQRNRLERSKTERLH